MFPTRTHQDPPVENAERLLNGALGKAGLLRDLTVAQLHGFLPFANCAPPQEEIDDEGGRTVVVSNQISQQHIRNVFVETKVSHPPYSE